MMKAQGTPEVGRILDLGEATLTALEDSLPAVVALYDRLLRSENGILNSDAGRYYSQNPEVVETILRYVMESRFPQSGQHPEQSSLSINFGANELNMRAEAVSAAIVSLRKLGPSAPVEGSESAKMINANAGWVSRAIELIDSRNTLIAGYLSAVPKALDVSKLPTLQEEVNATFARRIATREALLNEVERKAEKEKAQRLAEITRQIRAEELEDQIAEIEALAEEEKQLRAAIHERQRLEIELQWREKLAASEREFQERMAAMEKTRVELEAKLAAQAAELEKARRTMTAETQVRELPQDARVLLRILSAKGSWKPALAYSNKRQIAGARSQYGLDPQPHSLDVLAGIGALDDTAHGIYMLYAIMATKADTERPRFARVFQLDSDSSAVGGVGGLWYEQTELAELSKSADAKEATKKIRRIQEIVRDYGDILVEQGLLAP